MQIDRAARLNFNARLLERAPGSLFVIDDEAEVAMTVGRLCPPRRERDELVAHVDEGHAPATPAQLELEDAPVELERLHNVAHLEGDVVQADEPRTGYRL